jgi:hypothetical protein
VVQSKTSGIVLLLHYSALKAENADTQHLILYERDTQICTAQKKTIARKSMMIHRSNIGFVWVKNLYSW